ncbi:MAG: hypothetical protein HQ485_00885 [Acidobacteria bacterium]|nr:hypothetical protein [Acidobacteriota bacterium]
MLRHLRIVGFAALVMGVAFSGTVRSSLSAAPPLAPAQAGQMGDPFDSLHFRSIGPATMSGRITDLAVYDKNPAVFYVSTAHGGVWKTTSNGATYDALFQDQGLMSVGTVEVSPKNPNLVWIGTGESNNRQSSSWGNGVWKSTDAGATWKNMGLGESYHINRIVIHPDDNNTVLVAATGSLFGPGGDRGVYKTTDGGTTWKAVLTGDADTGANDLVIADANPDIMYASMYQRRRLQCCMNGGGPGSGVFKSTDGGDTWARLEGGLPTVDMGRIGLDVYRPTANTVYALIEAEGPAGGGGRGGGGGGAAAGGRGGAPAEQSPTGLYRSDDGGESWKQVSTVNPRPMYFSQVRVDPNNPDVVYMGGVGVHMSIDGGRSFVTDAAQAIHDDIHALWIDPMNSDHVLIGGDGGVAVTYDQSKTWTQHNNLPLGLYYHVSYDMQTPYNVCGGLQDNYNWCGPSATRFTRGILNSDFYQVQGGDGFVVLVDPNNPNIVFSESQNGNISRKNQVTGESTGIRPSFTNTDPPAADGALPFRFNWDTPLVFSPNESGTILAAANKVFRSSDRGDSWSVISPDLTTNTDRDEIAIFGKRGDEIRIARNDGITSWGTIVTLAESPKQAGVYYTGTDDGVVSVSQDMGKTWTRITNNIPGFPAGAWVSKVAPSRFDAGTVYVTVDAHRIDDRKTYMWVSHDFGATFTSINANLSGEVVKTLTEDPKNADVLYIGTEAGLFLSMDRAKSWQPLKANLPTVRIDEIAIHPRDNAMIVGTHGRSVWILDHLEPIQEYAAAQAATSDATLFSIGPALQWRGKDHQNDEFWGHNVFIGENPPTEAVIQFHLKKPVGSLSLQITDAAGKAIRTVDMPANRNQAGIQTVCWDMRVDPAPAIITPAAPGGAGRQGAGGGGQGGARGGGRGPGAVPGVPQAPPSPGSDAKDPCADNPDGGGGGGGGRGGFGGGGGGSIGPWVLPGTYNVALMVDGSSVGVKPMRVVLDPANQLTDTQRKRYNDIVMDLHDMQTRGVNAANAIMPFHTAITDLVDKIEGMENVPAATKTQFAAVQQEWDTVREKFGVPPAAGGGGGRGRGGAPANPDDVLGKSGAVKSQVMAFYDLPSNSLMGQYNDVRLAMPRAITELNNFLKKATSLSQELAKSGVTLAVPSAVK